MNEPKWLTLARSRIGTREFSGTANNPIILQWATRLHGWISRFYDADSIPWCGLFVAFILNEAGLQTIGDKALTALAWRYWGQELSQAIPGAVLVFERTGGGHVGFYTAEDDACYHVLGGNQGDAVSVARILKSRCVAIRWPNELLPSGVPVMIAAAGNISKNEA